MYLGDQLCILVFKVSVHVLKRSCDACSTMTPGHQVLRGVFSVGCMCATVVAESHLPSALLAAVTYFASCGHTGQSLVPALLRGLGGLGSG